MKPYWIVLAIGYVGAQWITCHSLRETGRAVKERERFGFWCSVIPKAEVSA
jgi:hypothetical protein